MSKNSELDCDALLRSASKACPMPGTTVREAVRRECTAGLCQKRSISRRGRLVACAVLIAFLVGGSALLGSGVLGIGYAWTALWGATGWAVVLLAVLGVNLKPAQVHPVVWRFLTLVGLPVAFYWYLLKTGVGTPPFLDFIQNTGACMHVAACGGMSSLVGAVAAAGLFYVWRGSDPFSPRRSGIVLGLVAGISGALVAGFVCPGQDAWHVVLGHGLSLVLMTIAGAAIGRRVLSP